MSSLDQCNGRWRVRYSVRGRQRAKYFDTKEEAKNYHKLLNQKIKTDEPKVAFHSLVYQFFFSGPGAGYHSETRRKLEAFFARGIGSFLMEKTAEDLTRQDLEELRTRLREKGTSSNTINKYQAYVRAILAWAADQGYIKHNPWSDFKKLKADKFEFKATFEDFQKILSVAPEWLHWALLTCYALSLRPGHKELFSLEWTAFKWRYGYVLIPHQGKSDKPKKVIPPENYLRKARTRYNEDRPRGIIWVCHRNGKRVNSYRTAWLKALRDAGLEGSGIRFYDIRHISATEMLANGADLAAVAAQLGHSNTHTTAMTYVHVLPEAQLRAATLLTDLEEDNES